jgi:hypothetical protein
MIETSAHWVGRDDSDIYSEEDRQIVLQARSGSASRELCMHDCCPPTSPELQGAYQKRIGSSGRLNGTAWLPAIQLDADAEALLALHKYAGGMFSARRPGQTSTCMRIACSKALG